MTKNEYKILENKFAECGLALEINDLFGSIDAVIECSGAPLANGRVVTQYGLMPCFPDDDFEDVLEAIIRFADSFDRNVQAFTIYNGDPKHQRLSWDDCDKLAVEFIERVNAVADALSFEYKIARNPDLMSMDASVLEWCEAALITDEEYQIDPALTFRQFDMSSEDVRIALCNGDKVLAETLTLSVETRHDHNLYSHRASRIADDLLITLQRGTGDWRKRKKKK